MLVIDDSGPGGGRTASLGFFFVFVSFAFFAGEYAWRGRRTVLVAYRTPGRVTIEGDILTIDAPGTVTVPVQIHRAWVEGAEQVAGYETSATSFSATLVKGVCVIRLSQSIGIPQALTPPSLPRDSTRLPQPSATVEAITLDFEVLSAATEAIDQWAKDASATEPGEPLSATAKDHTARNRRLMVWAVLVASLISLQFTVPSWSRGHCRPGR